MGDAFVEAQESIVNELNIALNELKVGMYESVYNRLTDLCDELTTDIIISKAKELSSSDQTER
jgi:hypothetical protein